MVSFWSRQVTFFVLVFDIDLFDLPNRIDNFSLISVWISIGVAGVPLWILFLVGSES